MMNALLLPVALGVFLVVVLLLVRWKWRVEELWFYKRTHRWWRVKGCLFGIAQASGSRAALQHAPCFAPDLELERKDSLDGHLDSLTKKLAEKIRTDAQQEHKVRWVTCNYLELKEQGLEGRLRISKSKIREAQCEIDNLHSIDVDVRDKYREVMDSLRSDLTENERECKRLQEQIEWVSRRRAEIRDDVRKGQKLYGEAAAELASNLVELQRGRATAAKFTAEAIAPQEQAHGWCRSRHRDGAQPTYSYIRPLYHPTTTGTVAND